MKWIKQKRRINQILIVSSSSSSEASVEVPKRRLSVMGFDWLINNCVNSCTISASKIVGYQSTYCGQLEVAIEVISHKDAKVM